MPSDRIIKLETKLGDFSIRLCFSKAPITAGYFAELVSCGALNGSSIYRIVGPDNASLRAATPIEVIQGGLKDSDPQPVAAIAHEPTSITGLSHAKWTVSTARFDPGQTYGSFFVCMRDEPSLDEGGARHPDGHGFAAFGAVCDGFSTLELIFAKRCDSEFLSTEINILRAYLAD